MSVEKIRENNIAINFMIKKLIESKRKDQNYRDTGFQIEIDEDGKKKLDINPDIKELLKLEFKKCLMIYEMEFGKSFNFNDEKATNVSLYEKEGIFKFPDCSGGTEGLRMPYGMSERMNNMLKIIEKMTENIHIEKNGNENIVSFSENGNYDSNNVYDNLSVFDSKKEFVGSLKDQFDYSMYLFATGAIDLDFVIDALAHEAMHTYGVVGGINFFKEGMTEELTREMGDKYGLHMTATAHTQETEFMRKLELLVGRDLVVDAAMYNYKLDSWRNEELGKLLNDKDFGLENIELKELQEIFKLARYDEEKLNKPEYVDELNKLRNFKKGHNEAYTQIEEIIKQYNYKSKSVKYTENVGYDKNTRYGEIAESFDKQIGKEGAFEQYANVLDNMYDIAMNFKNDPIFLRELYTKTWEELKEILENSKVKEKDNDKLIKIYEDTIKSLNEISKTCKSYDDLMAPINEKIKGKKLKISNTGPNADLEKKIIEIQEEERKLLREKFKITEEPQEVKTNTEISLGEISEESLQKASKTVEKAENIEIQDLVNSSRNNSNVVLGVIDESVEKNAKYNNEIQKEEEMSKDALRM